MSRFLAVLACVTSLCASTFAQTDSEWEFVGGQGISDGSVFCCQIVADRQGSIYVSYQDHSLGPNPASVKRYTNGAWSYVGGKGNASVGTAWYNHLAFDTLGRLYIASRDYGVAGRLNLRRFPGFTSNGWQSAGTGGASVGDAHFTHIAVGPDEDVFAVFADQTQGNHATVRRFWHGAWTNIGSPGFTSGSAGYTSLAVDAQGRVYVGYSDGDHTDVSGEGKLTVMRYTPSQGSWQTIGNPGFTQNGALNARLALDNAGTPYVAYQHYHSRIVVMRFNGTQWVQVGGSASGWDRPVIETESWRQWVSLAFDSQNKPYVAYQLLDDGRKAAVRRLEGNSWVPVGDVGFSPGSADYMSMAIDTNDVPHVVFRDSTVGYKATVMRFSSAPVVYCSPTTDSVGCTPEISAFGTPSVSQDGPFRISAEPVISNRAGMLLYSFQPAQQSFAGGMMCIGAPFSRVGLQSSGGTPGVTDCSGTLLVDFNQVIQGGSNPGLTEGRTVYAQFWYRDAQGRSGKGVSNAVRFRIRN